MQCPTVIPCIRKTLNNDRCDGPAWMEKDSELMYIDHSGAVVWEKR